MNKSKTNKGIDPKTTIGHIHLKVANLKRSIKFYTEILGFELTTKIGSDAAFLSTGEYHHHIGINTWESKNGTPPPQGSTGLYHFAILVPNRKELARVFNRLRNNNWPIEGAADHGVSESIYLSDPDGNGIEIYADKPRDKWPYDKGKLVMYTRPLDINNLLQKL